MKNLTIHCKDFDLTDAIKDYSADKISSLEKYLSDDKDTATYNLRLGKTTNHHNAGKIFYAELAIAAPQKHYDAKIESEDIYTAIDLLKDEMANNIRSYRERQRTVSRHEALKFKEKMLNDGIE